MMPRLNNIRKTLMRTKAHGGLTNYIGNESEHGARQQE